VTLALLACAVSACGHAAHKTSYPLGWVPPRFEVQIVPLEAAASSWRLPPAFQSLRGLRLLYDAPVPGRLELAVTRSVLRSNPQLAPLDALIMATRAVGLARAQDIDPGFFGATLLQESAFDPRALSAAGAVGIAQFTLDTADSYGVDPFDWSDAMRGSARLLGDYLRDYRSTYDDPYAATLAAYNAGPGAVDHYRGVPPYPETKEYIGDVYDRWSRIVRDATGAGRPTR
jgi:soluble lytic murein transglycosylase-like protein